MVVAVQKGLENLKENLRSYGYEVVTYGEYRYPVDALIYHGSLGDVNSIEMHVEDTEENFSGIFLINGTNKSAAQLDKILKQRSYSPLF